MTWKRRHLLFLLVSTSLAVSASGAGADGWARLKGGMTSAEMSAVLGAPLIKSGGRQFEVWIYDAGAEVVCFRGMVVAWTAPEGSGVDDGEGRQIAVRVLPRAVAPPPPPKRVYVPRGEANAGLERTPMQPARLRRF